MTLTDEQRARLAALREGDAERALEAAEAADARELEVRELRALLEGRGLKDGVDFKVVDNKLGGTYAVKKPDSRAIRNWEQADDKKKQSLEWLIGLLRHYIVEPDEKTPGARATVWSQTCAQRAGLCWDTANAFVELMGVDVESHQRK